MTDAKSKINILEWKKKDQNGNENIAEWIKMTREYVWRERRDVEVEYDTQAESTKNVRLNREK